MDADVIYAKKLRDETGRLIARLRKSGEELKQMIRVSEKIIRSSHKLCDNLKPSKLRWKL